MLTSVDLISGLRHPAATAQTVLVDVGRFLTLCMRMRAALAAENLFLRKQLALFAERQAQPRQATDAVRFGMTSHPARVGGTLQPWPSSQESGAGHTGADNAPSGAFT